MNNPNKRISSNVNCKINGISKIAGGPRRENATRLKIEDIKNGGSLL
jgi:hypothetical protein